MTEYKEPFTPSTTEVTPTMVTSVQITRRKLFTFIMRKPGDVVYAGNSVEEALKWLRANDWSLVDLISPTGRWSLKYLSPITEKEAQLWLGQQLPFSDLMPPDK